MKRYQLVLAGLMLAGATYGGNEAAPFLGGSADGYGHHSFLQFDTNAMPLLAAPYKGGGYDGYNLFIQANTTAQSARRGTVFLVK